MDVLGMPSIADGVTYWEAWVNSGNRGDYWEAILGVLAAGGLAARGFLARRADLELTKQYASQGQIFETANHMLDTIANQPNPEWTAEKVLSDLGEEALQEQGEWLWLRHTRPFEVPTP